jgi:hypothetical protein
MVRVYCSIPPINLIEDWQSSCDGGGQAYLFTHLKKYFIE